MRKVLSYTEYYRHISGGKMWSIQKKKKFSKGVGGDDEVRK
jgi:hypothetical protein